MAHLKVKDGDTAPVVKGIDIDKRISPFAFLAALREENDRK